MSYYLYARNLDVEYEKPLKDELDSIRKQKIHTTNNPGEIESDI